MRTNVFATMMVAMGYGFGVADVENSIVEVGPGMPYPSIQAGVNIVAKYGVVLVYPKADGSGYDETVTIPRSKEGNFAIVGMGGRGAAFIEPSTEDTGGMIVHADDVTIINLGIAAEDDTVGNYALTGTGSRFRAYGCKIEGGERQVSWGPGTVAQEAAGTHGNSGDILFEDCEFCWGTNGIVLVCTDYGAVTQFKVRKSHFHNISGKHVTEEVGSGGSAAVTFQNVVLDENTHDDLDVGTAPTNYIDLNGDNANTGVVSRCVFPTAINSGLNLVSTAMHWVCNYHTGGISTGQPS